MKGTKPKELKASQMVRQCYPDKNKRETADKWDEPLPMFSEG